MTWSSFIFPELSIPPVSILMKQHQILNFFIIIISAYVSAARLPPADDATNTYIGWAGRTSGWGAAEDGKLIFAKALF